jgi:hypothetical protein
VAQEKVAGSSPVGHPSKLPAITRKKRSLRQMDWRLWQQ